MATKTKRQRAVDLPRSCSASIACQWTPAEKWMPPDPEPVLAYDMGTHYVASWNGNEWIDCSTEEPIDCFITHWRWLDTPEDE